MKFDSIYLSPQFLVLVIAVTVLHRVSGDSVSELCELSFKDSNKVYHYSLVSPLRKFPHGILSEDGFYKVAANGTVLWFQVIPNLEFWASLPHRIQIGIFTFILPPSVPEFLPLFSAEIQRTFARLQELIFSSQLLSCTVPHHCNNKSEPDTYPRSKFSEHHTKFMYEQSPLR
ncbi:UNVERIFIED_CONTAM: hypothetical protein Sradi_6258800 [Sesamum radiatum]|uniref:Uncharacterized protein n=1 Tax=Sesamum radiatum TaxID=300843 RepID=A0AAW2KCH5_SESRA